MLFLHVRLRCGSLSITTQMSLLANEFGVRSVLHGQVSLAAVNQIHVIHEPMDGTAEFVHLLYFHSCGIAEFLFASKRMGTAIYRLYR